MAARPKRTAMTPEEFDRKCRLLWGECRFLSETSGRRSYKRNERVKGKKKSKHPYGMAKDFAAPSVKQLHKAMGVARQLGFWVQTHDVGSGQHLHVQGLAPGNPPKWWVEKYGKETGFRWTN